MVEVMDGLDSSCDVAVCVCMVGPRWGVDWARDGRCEEVLGQGVTACGKASPHVHAATRTIVVVDPDVDPSRHPGNWLLGEYSLDSTKERSFGSLEPCPFPQAVQWL